jgi:hypothetical protein
VGPALWDFGVRNFASSVSKHQHKQTSEMRKRKGETHISGFRGSGPNIQHTTISRVPVFKHQHKQTFELRKGKVRLTFRDFGVQGFGVSKTKQQHTNSRIAKSERCGPTLSGFWDSGFRGFIAKQQHTTTPEFQKVKGCGTNTSGFRDSGFRGLEKQGNFA